MSTEKSKQTRARVPGHPGVYKRGARYQARYRDPDRGQVVSRTFDTLREAAKFKRDTQAGRRPRQPSYQALVEQVTELRNRVDELERERRA